MTKKGTGRIEAQLTRSVAGMIGQSFGPVNSLARCPVGGFAFEVIQIGAEESGLHFPRPLAEFSPCNLRLAGSFDLKPD
jgi:hypothetical protein